jgi:hypothetical protein
VQPPPPTPAQPAQVQPPPAPPPQPVAAEKTGWDADKTGWDAEPKELELDLSEIIDLQFEKPQGGDDVELEKRKDE